MLLGRAAPRGPLLATEDRARHPLRRRWSAVQGDRGSVALIGPTRSGKTVLVSAGIVAWDGPVVALSVKRDLYNTTAAARASRGEIAMFDPSRVTGLPTARWTPLRDVETSSGALRSARALANAIPHAGVSNGDYWAQHGETFIGAYLCLAGLSRLITLPDGSAPKPLTISRLAGWAYMQVGIDDPTVNQLLTVGLCEDQCLEVQLLARNADMKLQAFHGEDSRIRDSIYATARLAFESWTDPSVAHSADVDPRPFYDSDTAFPTTPRTIDLDWLMGGGPDRANTLYLSAPATEFSRLAPVLGGLIGDLREQVHAWDIRNQRLEKPLLFVIDEAGQLELSWFPSEVSTIAGLGAHFVTCWQSRAQIADRYGTLADAVLGGHRSKVVFNGTDDPSTLDFLSRITGSEHVAQRGWSADVTGGRKTVSEHTQREELLPPHVIRQMRRQEAVLLHGSLPPIHLKAVLWWEDKELSKLVPTDANGIPVPPDDVPTCPLTDEAAGNPVPVVDPETLREARERLAKKHRHTPGGGSSGGGSPVTPTANANATAPMLRLVPSPDDEPEHDEPDLAGVEANRWSSLCDRCGILVQIGEGVAATHRTGRTTIRHHPTCPSH
jgi:type IV secretion system protein VirD4